MADRSRVAAHSGGQNQERGPNPLAAADLDVLADAVNEVNVRGGLASQFLLDEHQILFDQLVNLFGVQFVAL
jgi:hypothetical protein